MIRQSSRPRLIRVQETKKDRVVRQIERPYHNPTPGAEKREAATGVMEKPLESRDNKG
jgi:hypothetical protein